MPSHMITKLMVTGDENILNKFREKHLIPTNDEGYDGILFDFNTISEIPKELEYVPDPTPTKSTLDVTIKNCSDKDVKVVKDQIAQAKVNKKLYGYENWYQFCSEKWGTKWNSYNGHIYDESDDMVVIEFRTAYSFPEPIIEKLSYMYPELIFDAAFITEGIDFGGTQVWTNGTVLQEEFDSDMLDKLYELCNERFDGNYSKCKCGEWFDPDVFYDDGIDESLCEECNGGV